MQQGEIKATAFNQQAEDYINLLQLNKVFIFLIVCYDCKVIDML